MEYTTSRYIVMGFLMLLGAASHSQAECDGTGTNKEAVTARQPSQELDTSDASKDREPVQSVWMRVKLNGADGILRGLAEADFVAIQHHAGVMTRLARVERWARVKNKDYQTHLQAFDQATRELIRQANNENLEGATLAYFQMTTSCVSCHRVIRDHEELFPRDVKALTHIVNVNTEYYLDGPQQARPADGTLIRGTLVAVVKRSGSYWEVLSEKGVRAFVAADALTKIDIESLGQ